MTTTARLTLEEFLALPDTKPGCEYINGRVVQKAMPNIRHGIIQGLLAQVLGPFIRKNRLGICGSEIRCRFGPAEDEQAFLPDFLFLTEERAKGLNLDGLIPGPPDLAVEILSPDDRRRDVRDKLDFYLTHGVRLVWLIDPKKRTLTVMTTPSEAVTLSEHQPVDGGAVLPGFSCTVADLLPSAEGL